MDKNAIKKYAVWARTELIERVTQKALQYGISEKEIVDANADSINGKLLNDVEKKQRKALIEKVNDKGFVQVMEEVAYTWFNRFIALRYLEVNGYLPTRVRVFTNDNNEFKPQILVEAINLDLEGIDIDKIYAYKEENKTEELYQYLLIAQCNALNSILPKMFQRISDYTELLLPNNLLREGSVIQQMIELISEEDWKDAVQILGWLYQYYNSEPKDLVFANLKKNIKVTKENIPPATQLFTPDWVVRYMVENSIGRLWLDGHPNLDLKNEWKYYLDEADQESNAQIQRKSICEEYKNITPEEIRCIDPCMGSGHILVYMFDVLIQIYKSYGYSEREAVSSIVQNNLYGLDIDDRAAQLAYFAVMMKARQYDRRFFTRGVQPHIYAFQEGNNIDSHCVEYFAKGDSKLLHEISTIITTMYNSKEYGSMIRVSNIDFGILYNRFVEIENDFNVMKELTINSLLPMVKVAEILSYKYDAVVTNPPYMGASSMGKELTAFVKEEFPNTKSDLSTVFMERTIEMCKDNGYMGMINIPVWMFISSYEKMRQVIIQENTIINMLHLGRGIFGSDFGSTAFVINKKRINSYTATYEKLFSKQGAVESSELKEKWFLERNNEFTANQERFNKVPGKPIAYWVSDRFIDNFSVNLVSSSHFSGGRNKTHNNEKYTRLWWEIADRDKWQLYVKGGDYRRWYGNQEVVVDWSDEAKAEYESHGGLYNQKYARKNGICWTLITSAKTAFRIKPATAHYDSGAPTIFNSDFTIDLELLGFLNSNVATEYLQLMNPTINMGNTYVLSLPNLHSGKDCEMVKTLVSRNIEIAKKEWDSYETSMDFQQHPLVVTGKEDILLRDVYTEWKEKTHQWFNEMKANEEELNEYYIKLYGLEGEISSEIPAKDVSIRISNEEKDIKSLLSYAVGCILGRYSLDELGLIYPGSERNTKYSLNSSNIVPIGEDDYFNEDIVTQIVKFIGDIYGKANLSENLKYIADVLGGKGSPKEVIRNYFINNFFIDHCKAYQKRPIYWLFDSGKKNGFKCLIYMQAYQPDTIARIRTDYVHEQQSRYGTMIEELEQRINNTSASDRVKLNKQLTKLKDQEAELKVYEEKIHHLADQMIPIDLDDGVKVNYAKFQDVLAKIK